MPHDMLSMITVASGLFSALVALYLAYYFFRLPGRLSAAVAWMMIGEFVMTGMASTFTILAMTGILDGVPELYRTMMRLVMFQTASITSVHLAKEMGAINRGE